MADLTVSVDGIDLAANWTDENPRTRREIEATLPLSGEAARWGEELYFETPVDVPEEDARAEVPVGAITYWPAGNAVCLFWGPTPASVDEEPRAASPVNVVAAIEDVSPLVGLDGGASVRIERA